MELARVNPVAIMNLIDVLTTHVYVFVIFMCVLLVSIREIQLSKWIDRVCYLLPVY